MYRVIQGKSPPPSTAKLRKAVRNLKAYLKTRDEMKLIAKKPKPNNQISEFCCNSKYATRNLQIAFFASRF